MLLDRLALELVDAYGDRRYGLSARSLMCGPPACRAGPGSESVHSSAGVLGNDPV